MELHYYKKVKENNKYETWFWDEGNVYLNPWYCPIIGDDRKLFYVQEEEHNPKYQGVVGGYCNGWTKVKKPKELTLQEELDWFIISDKEDIHFMMEEKSACHDWMMKEMNECHKALKVNKGLKNQYANVSSRV